jgi:hypothetical protein
MRIIGPLLFVVVMVLGAIMAMPGGVTVGVGVGLPVNNVAK